MSPRSQTPHTPEEDPLWYQDAVIYELHVRAFCDSDSDGIGDFPGLTRKLDYLQSLGVTALWLLPFFPSPLRDDGYDISDYTRIHPAYGTLADFKVFLREAHRRSLKVIVELVLNHTSDQHAWFQEAQRAKPGTRARDFYVWSKTADRYKGTRVIFKDFEPSNWTWDSTAGAYYWHRFFSHQPDLNYDNPAVRRAVLQGVDFWMRMGVDGLRLDAVPYLYEREGTTCENLPESHRFLKQLRRHVDRKFKNRMLLAEANQWPEEAAHYFGQGNECHMAFHFPLMPRLFMAIRMEDRFPILDILQQTPPLPEGCQWALFLRNHDELTLEMVTDEDRDYMYRVYAQDPQARIHLGIRRRLAPLLGNHRRKIELMNGLLFSLPGTPVLYYADEIGMGDNIYLGDRNAVRTPMQWSADRNAGFSRANPQRLYLPIIIDPEYHYEAVNVEAQQGNAHSLLWWMKRLMALRKQYKAFGRGSVQFLEPQNPKILAFIRRYETQTLLVVANLSRFVQYVELDLSAFQGAVPTELFGQTEFPPIGELPYLLTLGPHSFYWFSLSPQPASAEATPKEPAALPRLAVTGSWTKLLQGRARVELERILPGYLRGKRWFGGKSRKIRSAEVVEWIPLGEHRRAKAGSAQALLLLVQVRYTDAEPQLYTLPLTFSPDGRAEDAPQRPLPYGAVAELTVSEEGKEAVGILYDALCHREICLELLETISRRKRLRGAQGGELIATTTQLFRSLRGSEAALEPSWLKAEQSNTSVVYSNRLVLKMFRHLEEGINPDLEISRFLTERAHFPNTPGLAGAIEYRQGKKPPVTVAILQGFVEAQGDAWGAALDVLGRYYEEALTQAKTVALPPLQQEPLVEMSRGKVPAPVKEQIGSYLETARLLGKRTAQLHVALALEAGDPGFTPEPFSAFYQRSLYQSMRSLAGQVLGLLGKRLKELPPPVRSEAESVLSLEPQILKQLRSVLERRVTALRIRCHGDYHLGQVLYTGKDFVIIDFEGEPARPLSERRLKRSALRDVAGMLRSFHYAAYAALFAQAEKGLLSPENAQILEPWARFWTAWVSSAFLKAYLREASEAAFLPKTKQELKILLDLYLLEKALYELGYELNHRPAWLSIPLKGIVDLLGRRDRPVD